jgi:hypothetical protein
MPEIQAGLVTVLYLFDVAQEIDLAAVRQRLGAQAASARIDDKAPGPPRIRYVQPPVVADGQSLGCAELDGFRVRVKFYDYGVISLMLARPFRGDWAEFVSLGQALVESEPLEEHATSACRTITNTMGPALRGARPTFLGEDYLVFAVTALDRPCSAEEMLAAHGADIAQLLRGERQPLSAQERDNVLANRLSYLVDDLVVPAWNAAFVYDSEPAVLAATEIFEFANSHLLEFRYHDDLLEAELTQIYAQLQRPNWGDRLAWRRNTRAAMHVQSLFIDVNELTDRMENAVKFVGDVYAARLFGNVAARLGLDRWKRNVEEKLNTLNDIHRFAVEQAGMSQANILELVIVLILVIELGLFFAGVMR